LSPFVDPLSQGEDLYRHKRGFIFQAFFGSLVWEFQFFSFFANVCFFFKNLNTTRHIKMDFVKKMGLNHQIPKIKIKVIA
jgi:hypothetical protein